ncbi:MAG: flagellar hook assembly protein FlgD [Paenibacillaceae bacterium]|uniref:flagellar hook assembly protein FlgD n=1 Tax=Paenibacillus cymbidii TaxID=1639034 RepID=UPI00108090F9|nr:flagellar hook assembly protein FlgD [Paenibacillus cymbidii]MBO9609172.1 flagellar hook assembly protein FlgD [Paenibacillaceae bacterium]
MADSNIVGTKNVWPYYAQGNTSAASTKAGNTLGKDDFLKILMTQLSNQDPTQPLEDKDFIAQMAQFSSVEQMTNMAGEMKLLRQSLGMAPGLLGQSVTWTAFDDAGNQIENSGIVSALTFKDGKQYARVEGGAEITLDQITSIERPE